MPLQISDRVRALGAQAQDALSEQFARIDAIAEYNTQKVLSAFQTHKVAESMFQGTTGYGYDDLGRETLGAIYADLFGAEDAMVRINFVNGTHAISSALYGVLRPGDVLVSAIGAPYDTLQGVIGITGDGNGSLKEFGITYRQVDLTPENTPDLPGIAQAVQDPAVKAVLIQRSHSGLPLCGTHRRNLPSHPVPQPPCLHFSRQLLRRICGDHRAHTSRRRLDYGVTH